MLTYLLLWAKKFHRLLVLPISLLTIIMALTGMFLKEPFNNFDFIDYGLTRYVHNQISTIFTLILILMSLTGIILYFVPALRLKQVNDQKKTH